MVTEASLPQLIAQGTSDYHVDESRLPSPAMTRCVVRYSPSSLLNLRLIVGYSAVFCRVFLPPPGPYPHRDRIPARTVKPPERPPGADGRRRLVA